MECNLTNYMKKFCLRKIITRYRNLNLRVIFRKLKLSALLIMYPNRDLNLPEHPATPIAFFVHVMLYLTFFKGYGNA